MSRLFFVRLSLAWFLSMTHQIVRRNWLVSAGIAGYWEYRSSELATTETDQIEQLPGQSSYIC